MEITRSSNKTTPGPSDWSSRLREYEAADLQRSLRRQRRRDTLLGDPEPVRSKRTPR
jgi:hypothetical protein